MLLSELKWFLQQTSRNKIEIILVAIIVLLIYALRVQHVQLNRTADDYKRSDSIYRNRLNNTHTFYTKKLDECTEARIQEQVKQNELWLEQYEDLLEEVNKTYQNLKR